MTTPTEPTATSRGIVLEPEDREIARLSARGLTYTQVGEILGLSESTVYRRIRDRPWIRDAVHDERQDLVQNVLDQMSAGASQSVALLIEIVSDATQPVSVRTRAAETVINSWRGTGTVSQQIAQERENKSNRYAVDCQYWSGVFATSIKKAQLGGIYKELGEAVHTKWPDTVDAVLMFRDYLTPFVIDKANMGDLEPLLTSAYTFMGDVGVPEKGCLYLVLVFKQDAIESIYPHLKTSVFT